MKMQLEFDTEIPKICFRADHGRQTTSKEQTCQADDERLYLKIGDQKSLHHTIGDTNEQCQENRHIGIHSMMFHLIRNRHTYITI